MPKDFVIYQFLWKIFLIKESSKLSMHNIPKWSGTRQKSYSTCCKVFEVCLTILGRYALPVNLWFSATFLINFNSCEIVWEALSCNFRLISASLVDVIQLWYYQILFIPDFHIHVRKSEWFVNQFKWSCFSKNPVIWLAESIWVITWEKKYQTMVLLRKTVWH